MSDRWIPERVAAVALLILVALATPAMALARDPGAGDAAGIHHAAVPECADDSPDPNGGQQQCDDGTSGGGGLPSWVGTVLIGVVGAGVLAMLAAFLILRRRASLPAAPVDPTEWWTCPQCSSTNVIDSARCYSCGTLRR